MPLEDISLPEAPTNPVRPRNGDLAAAAACMEGNGR